MKLGVFSARLFDCGASIAALRSASLLSKNYDSVDYFFEDGSFEAEVRQMNPAVNISSKLKHKGNQSSSSTGPGSALRQYLDVIEAGQYDSIVVHNFDHPHECLNEFAEKVPTLWMMHDASPVSGLHYAMPSLDDRSILRYASRKGVPTRAFFERAAQLRMGFASPSRWLQRIAQHYVCGDTPVHLVRNSVSSTFFQKRDKTAARTFVGASLDAFVILFFAGRGAMERKNLLLLMQALQRIDDPKLQVLVIGGMPPSEMKPDPRCVFLPNFQQQRDPVRPSLLYSAADLFLLPSLVDNLPNTVLESYFCGTPVLASRSGGTHEMMIEGETGWLFDPRSVDDLTAKLQQIMAEKSLEKAGDKGLEFVREHFSEEVSLAQYTAALDSVSALQHGRKVAVPTLVDPPLDPPAEPIYIKDLPRPAFNDALIGNVRVSPDSHMAVYRDKWNPTELQKKWMSICYRTAAAGYPLRENERRIAQWQNAYEGKRAFLIGNGPSLNLCDISLLKDEITIGVNSIFLKREEMGGLPTHYVVEDFFVAEDRADQINALTGTTKWFGNYLQYCLKGDDVNWLNVRMRYDNYKNFPFFSRDLRRQAWVGGSVTFICMQLAFYLGIKELYLIGFDHHYIIPETTEIDGMNFLSTGDDPNHFDSTYFGKGLRWHDPKTDRMEQGYKKAGRTFERHGRKIYNATVGGKLEVLDRVDYTTLFPGKTVRKPVLEAAV